MKYFSDMIHTLGGIPENRKSMPYSLFLGVLSRFFFCLPTTVHKRFQFRKMGQHAADFGAGLPGTIVPSPTYRRQFEVTLHCLQYGG